MQQYSLFLTSVYSVQTETLFIPMLLVVAGEIEYTTPSQFVNQFDGLAPRLYISVTDDHTNKENHNIRTY